MNEWREREGGKGRTDLHSGHSQPVYSPWYEEALNTSRCFSNSLSLSRQYDLKEEGEKKGGREGERETDLPILRNIFDFCLPR